MVAAGRAEQKLAELMGRLGAYFTRVEPVRQAGKYVRGLMSDLPRKNCWTLAEYAGDRTPDRMQRLLQRTSWKTFEAMDTVRDFVVEHLADPEGLTVLALDESGDEKTGTHTARVKRQYVGCAGKVANAINSKPDRHVRMPADLNDFDLVALTDLLGRRLLEACGASITGHAADRAPGRPAAHDGHPAQVGALNRRDKCVRDWTGWLAAGSVAGDARPSSGDGGFVW